MFIESEIIPDTRTSTRLSKYRTITTWFDHTDGHAPSVKVLLETYETTNGQLKTFNFYIPLHKLSEFIDGLEIVERAGIDRGLIAAPVDADAADRSAGQ